MLEAAVVLDSQENAIHWHSPPNRTTVSIPDSRALWDVIWENRYNLSGVAHSHPGYGLPGPSYDDVTTFSAIESGLARRLTWWIISKDRVVRLKWVGPEPLHYQGMEIPANESCTWLEKLKELSYER